MIAVIRKPSIEIKGDIPIAFLEVMRSYFGPDIVAIKPENDIDTAQLNNTEWYHACQKKHAPATNMRFFRELHQMSQEELGKKLGNVHYQYISAMERGRRPISKKTALKLAEIFSVSVGYFIG